MKDVPTTPATALIDALSADWLASLDALPVAAYLVDHERRVRWQNAASLELVGDVRGKLDSTLLSPSDLARARIAFAQKRFGATQTALEVIVTTPDGSLRRVAVSSVPVRNADGEMIGSFGLASVLDAPAPTRPPGPALSAREHETLALLAAGRSTPEMAQHMGLAIETVRNHVKRLLRRLDAHSRLEAVAKAHELGLDVKRDAGGDSAKPPARM